MNSNGAVPHSEWVKFVKWHKLRKTTSKEEKIKESMLTHFSLEPSLGRFLNWYLLMLLTSANAFLAPLALTKLKKHK